MLTMGQRLADYRVFWRQFRQQYHTTGAVLPSGRGLCRALSHFVRAADETPGTAGMSTVDGPVTTQLAVSRRILEVGPGTGAATTQIVRDLRPTDQLTLVELNDKFVQHLRERLQLDTALQLARDRITIIHSGVEELPEAEPYDVIVSGLPLNNFSVDLVDRLLNKMIKLLAPSGTLSFFEYVAIRRMKAIVSPRSDRERLCGIAGILHELLSKSEIRRDLVLANVPPAWVHHVRTASSTNKSRAN